MLYGQITCQIKPAKNALASLNLTNSQIFKLADKRVKGDFALVRVF